MVRVKDIFEYKEFTYLLLLFLGFVIGYLIGSNSTNIQSIQSYSANSDIIDGEIQKFNNSIIFPLVAVTSEGLGVLEYAMLSYTKGTGKIFLNINPFVETDTQYVLESAIDYICKKYDFNCKDKNFYLSINSTAQLVGGPSAGLAFALATYYLLNNNQFPNDVAVTGAVDPNGIVYKVGGIFEKALAAAQAGKKIFIIPRGQSVVYKYERVEKSRQIAPGFYVTEIYYKPVPFNLSQYFYERYGLKIYEVSRVDEAIELLKNLGK